MNVDFSDHIILLGRKLKLCYLSPIVLKNETLLMPQWFTELQTYVMANHQDWSSSVLFITIASFFAWVAWRILYSRLEILFKKTSFHWDDLLLEALKTPISTLIWCWPATVSLGSVLQSELGNEFNWLSTAVNFTRFCTNQIFVKLKNLNMFGQNG